MKTEYQILQEITRLENLNVSPDVDYLTRINALEWVLDGKKLTTGEADSNAVLADVRALKDEAEIMSGIHPSKDARFFAKNIYKFLCEHFS